MGNINGQLSASGDRYKPQRKDDIGVDLVYDALPVDQIHQGKVGKFTMKSSKLDGDLLQFLTDEDWMKMTDNDLLAAGFRMNKDNPYLDDQYYVDGYFHGKRQSEPLGSLNPRNGQYMDKPAAPCRVRAFIQATQKKNKKLFEKLPGCFEEGSSMRNLFEQGNQICDLEIQTRYGTGLYGDHLNWHVDTFNSMLHMTVTLHGKRILQAKTLTKDGSIKQYSMEQVPGDVYLSSPAAFQHCVGHQSLKRTDRIVAVQCRVLMTMEDYANIFKEYIGEPNRQVEAMENIAKLLMEESFLLPSLDEVQQELSG